VSVVVVVVAVAVAVAAVVVVVAVVAAVVVVVVAVVVAVVVSAANGICDKRETKKGANRARSACEKVAPKRHRKEWEGMNT
jgi:hypothetical protein